MSGSTTYTLEEAERDLRNVYYLIRTSRRTNWAAVNKARGIKAVMKIMGVRRHELIDAMYCLKRIDCKRCNKNANGIPCYEISKRRKKAAENEARETKYIESQNS